MDLTESKYRNVSLLRALTVLDCFTADIPELNVTEVARKIGMPITTAHRILVTLTEGRWLERNIQTGRYSIGPSLYAKGHLYLGTTDTISASGPVIEVLNELTGEAISVGILYEGNLIVIMKEESKHAFRFATHIGTSLPAYASSMGKALLSELDEKVIDKLYPVENLIQVTSKTISTKAELKRDLGKIRATGISINLEGGYEGVVGISSIIRNSNGKASAAMAISVPTHRINSISCQKLGETMKLGASLASYRLGYQGVVNPVRDIEEIKSYWAKYELDLLK